jgi:hypothetical protein
MEMVQGETNSMRKSAKLGWSKISVCILITALSGCAGTSMSWPTSQPRVPVMTGSADPYTPTAQNCISIKQATPSQFVCHGKVYTAQQLQKIRETGVNEVASSSH